MVFLAELWKMPNPGEDSQQQSAKQSPCRPINADFGLLFSQILSPNTTSN